MITDKPGIVIARPPKRTTRKQPQPAITGPVIVKRERRKPAVELPVDPEAEARARAFLARMIRPVDPPE
jgi:hypothetical protein